MERRPLEAAPLSVQTLNEALRLYRRLILRIMIVVFGGFALVIALSYLSHFLSPPYGVHLFGWSLTEWGMVILVVSLVGYLWRMGRRIGLLLGDPGILAMPVIGVLSAPAAIAPHAHAMGMEWTGFFGPLRPVKR